MPAPFVQQIGLDKLGPDEYISKVVPARMGNAAPIAYGGNTLGLAVHAACLSVPSTHHLYSILGHYLGPATLTHKVKCKVERTRDTRSFATRRVQLLQEQPNGGFRACMDLMLDFQVQEQPEFVYSAPPVHTWPAAEACPTLAQLDEMMISAGKATKKDAAVFEVMFNMMESFFQVRSCVDSVSAQNFNSIAKRAVTTQDHLPITSKTSAEWYRLQSALRTEAEQMAALAFLMDGGLSFLPLAHDHMSFDDVSACSSLDFAVRIFVSANEVNLGEWHLKERLTSAADAGRTYSEGRLWDAQGRIVASMTQQSIMRRKPGPKPAL